MPAIRQILLIGHTHHDVGYTNSPRLIDELHRDVVGEVLRLAEEGPTSGPAAFRWTFEVARPVLRFVRDAAPADVERLAELAAQGRISITGGYLNMTQLPSETEFDAAYDSLQTLAEAGIRVRTEQHGDVNGIAWGTVEQMRRAGVERLVMALNPDHGRAPLPQPSAFWWEGPSGDRVFTFLSTHYGFGEEWGIVDGDVDLAERRIGEFVEALEARDDYPFDVALVHAGNDNRWPTARFLDVVNAWNAAHPSIAMRTATIDEALDVLQGSPAIDGLPVLRGEWSDWWSHGHGSTAREVAVYREARSFAHAGQAMAALAELTAAPAPPLSEVMGYRRGPVRLRTPDELRRDLAHVDEQLLLFGEHTWGSWETYSKPFSTFSHSAWNAKAAFAYDAYDQARDLALESWFRLTGAPANEVTGATHIVAVNPTARERTEIVTAEIDGTRRARSVVTVPGFGVAAVPVPPPPTVEPGTTVETDRYRVVVDPERGGIRSLVHLPTGRELVDATVEHGLGAIVLEQVDPDDPHPMLTRNPKDIHPDFPGPDFRHVAARGERMPEIARAGTVTELRWRSTPPDLPEAETTLVLAEGSDELLLEVSLVKPERFGPESIFVAFPFAVDDPEFLLETAGAVYAADREQLPDTSRDWYSIQHAIGVHARGRGILWESLDAPLVQLGGFHTGRWARELAARGGHINSWLMNNLHFTNFQARQDGTRRYRYRFRPVASGLSRELVRLAGVESLAGLQARAVRGASVRAGVAGLEVTPVDRVAAELRPVAGGIRVRLRNLGATPVEASVVFGETRVTRELPGHGRDDVVLDPGASAV
jgi:hypothetical protein